MTDNPTPNPPGAPRTPIDPAGTATPPPPPPGYVPAVYVQEPSGTKAATKVLLYLLIVALLSSIMVNIYLSKYGPVVALLSAFSATGPQEELYYPKVTPSEIEDRIVVVEISGTIDGPTAAFARDAFYQLKEDPPAAVILRVESGGGGVTASDQIWHAIQEFRAEHKDIPVIASFGTVAASGGYYIAAPTDYIFCERTGITGSIGVLAQVPAAGGLVEKLGVEMNMIIADKSPNKDDANDFFVEWYDDEGELTEAGQAATAVLKNLVNDAYDTFLDVVVTGRQAANKKITKAELEQAATGAIFIGEEAVDAKLVDKIGYLDDAIEYAAKQANIKEDPKVTVLRESTPGLLGSMVGKREGVDLTDVTGADLRGLIDDASAVRLEYRMRLR